MKVRSTAVSCLVRAEESGIYYARVKVAGKLYWRSLQTATYSTARARLPDKLLELRGLAGASAPRSIKPKCTFAEAVELYRKQIDGDTRLKPRSKVFRMRSELTLRRTWPEVFNLELRRITHEALASFLRRFEGGDSRYLPPNAKLAARPGNSATTVNALIGFFRRVFEIGVRAGICSRNPANELRRKSPTKKLLRLPNRLQFARLVAHIRSYSGWRPKAADLIEGLAYTGLRVGESRVLTWSHVDFERDLLHVPGEKTNSSTRTIPLIPAAKHLLSRMHEGRVHTGDDLVFEVAEATESLSAGCKAVGIPKLTHHDLRHLFATTCIESGVDVPTVATWLGHCDGGALAMRTYGHMRPEHSVQAAKKVLFG